MERFMQSSANYIANDGRIFNAAGSGMQNVTQMHRIYTSQETDR